MLTIKDIYTHCKTNAKPMLMTQSILALYPNIPDNTSNFIADYLANHVYYDRVFTQKYKSKVPIFIDEKQSFPSIYDEWVENCNDFIILNLEKWALLYFSMCNPEENFWNPLHNYDGKSHIEVSTVGLVENLSGTDELTRIIGEGGTIEKLGDSQITSTDYEVPTDDIGERETSKTVSNSALVTNETTTLQRDDVDVTAYGKKNDVDYTVTTDETKGGNLGVTQTVDMINSLQKMIPFWEIVFSTLASELTMWKVGD